MAAGGELAQQLLVAEWVGVDAGAGESLGQAAYGASAHPSGPLLGRHPGEASGQGDGPLRGSVADDLGGALVLLGEPTGRHHDITGPESADLAGIASITAEVWETPVAYMDIPAATYCAETAGTGLDPWWLYAFSSMFASVREQRWDRVCNDYTRLTGRLPLALRDVLPAQVSESDTAERTDNRGQRG
ncbi:Rossmann-fold NAD(P)-binding domain-containing protein [Streptomyces cinereoruber]|uniref:hypothetical protein n=1 Tax=Streptomyces cinereoruber TaxID=67260 RepID=UPI00364232EE